MSLTPNDFSKYTTAITQTPMLTAKSWPSILGYALIEWVDDMIYPTLLRLGGQPGQYISRGIGDSLKMEYNNAMMNPGQTQERLKMQ